MTGLAKRPEPQTEAEMIIEWVEAYCQLPNGKPVQLNFAQMETVRQIYDRGEGPDDFEPLIERQLKTYLALCHLCGIRAAPQQRVPATLSGLNLFSV